MGGAITHLLAILGGSGSVALGLVAAGVIAAVLVVVLLLFLCATSEHGEDGRGGDRLRLLQDVLSAS